MILLRHVAAGVVIAACAPVVPAPRAPAALNVRRRGSNVKVIVRSTALERQAPQNASSPPEPPGDDTRLNAMT
jgi:hypothetical protein